MTGLSAGGSAVTTGAGIAAATGAATGSAVTGVDSGEVTGMMPEHCLHRIFFPMSVCDTLDCHLQVGQTTVILEPLEASGTCPRTIGAAAFLAGWEADGC